MRTYASFWIFGLVNNVLYVVILSAAVDLVGPLTPKAVVLMADVLPSFLCKLTAPFYIHLVPYAARIWILMALSVVGMLLVSLNAAVGRILFGIVLASASSGLGEVTFLQLTHYFGEGSLNGWASGTGGAGLIGSFVFMLMTTILGISVSTSLLVFSVVPFTFLLCYFKLLPNRPVDKTSAEMDVPHDLETMAHDLDSSYEPLVSTLSTETATGATTFKAFSRHVFTTLRRIRPFVQPYMVPLFTVYMAEYIINQGISPTLLFPLDEMPFAHFRDAYVTYGTLYQLGVFISRSSGPFFQLDHLYLPSILQMVNLAACILQSLFVWMPNIYIVMALVFYEGLLGGLSYINTFRLVTERTPLPEREFAMGCVGISDSAGIVIAASISMFLEPALCKYQVHDGREYCTLK